MMIVNQATKNMMVLILLVTGLNILFVNKPVHVDEANFLALSKGSWWAPHYIEINWQGTKEKAFDVLSNPPGIAWWLHLLEDFPLSVRRFFMLPWAVLALWGSWKIGERFTANPFYVALLTVCWEDLLRFRAELLYRSISEHLYSKQEDKTCLFTF